MTGRYEGRCGKCGGLNADTRYRCGHCGNQGYG